MGRFDDLLGPDDARFYPGSNQRRDTPRNPGPQEPVPFDGVTPRRYQVGNELVDFFTTGQLGEALGRRAVTMRKWEADGILPKATFVAPNPAKDPRARRRLYSRAQAEGIVRIAIDERLVTSDGKQTWQPVSQTRFTERVVELFRELQKK